MSSNTQRSKQLLEKQGYLVAIVEKWNAFARVRQDLFGFADLLAIKGDETVAVQTTSISNVGARRKKIISCPAAALWGASAYRKIVIHGWAKKQNRWCCKESAVFE